MEDKLKFSLSKFDKSVDEQTPDTEASTLALHKSQIPIGVQLYNGEKGNIDFEQGILSGDAWQKQRRTSYFWDTIPNSNSRFKNGLRINHYYDEYYITRNQILNASKIEFRVSSKPGVEWTVGKAMHINIYVKNTDNPFSDEWIEVLSNSWGTTNNYNGNRWTVLLDIV